MKKLLSVLLSVLSIFIGYTQDDIFNIQPKNYVSDYANIIDDNQESKMNIYLKTIQDSTTIQFFVLTINSTQNYDISEYSQKIGEKWGVGQKETDNGILFIVAVDDRSCFIATGYGVEDILPDGKCSSICRENFNPYAKNSDYTGGTWEIIKTVNSVINDKYEPTINKPTDINWEGVSNLLLTIMLITIIILLFLSQMNYIKKKKEIEEEIKEIFDDVQGISNMDFHKYEKEMLKPFINEIDDNMLLLFDIEIIKYNKEFLNRIQQDYDNLMNSIEEYYKAEKKVRVFRYSDQDKTKTIKIIETLIKETQLKERELKKENIKIINPYIIKVDYFLNLFNEIKIYYDEKNYDKFNKKYTLYENELKELNYTLNKYNDILIKILKCKEVIKKSDNNIKECIFNIVKFSDKKHSYYKKEIKEKCEEKIDEINTSYDNWKKLLKLNQYDVITMVDKLNEILKIGEDFISYYTKKIKKKEDDKRNESSYRNIPKSSYSIGSSFGSGSSFGGGAGGSFSGGGGGSRWG